jgi:hypothetical protein
LRPPFFAVLLRLDFLPELFRAPPFLRPPLFAAAMLSLHDEVELSQVPRWNQRVLHHVPTGTRVAKQTQCDNELASLLETRREYRMQEMCVQYFSPPVRPMHHHFQKRLAAVRLELLARKENFFPELQRSGCE